MGKPYRIICEKLISTKGAIPEVTGTNTEIMFVVNVIDDVDYIQSVARKMLFRGIRKFGFAGKHRQLWENCFDMVDVCLHPDGKYDDGIALTAVYDSIEDLFEAVDLSDEENVYVF